MAGHQNTEMRGACWGGQLGANVSKKLVKLGPGSVGACDHRLRPQTVTMNMILAVTTAPVPVSTLEKIRAIPADSWLRLGLAVVVLVAFIVVLRKVAKMNKVVLTAVTFFVATVVGFNWIYERTEPEWARPVVSFLAGFLPTKGPPPKPATTAAKSRP